MNWRRRQLTVAGFGAAEQKVFLGRLSGMLQAGIPLRTAFETLARFPGSPQESRIGRFSQENLT